MNHPAGPRAKSSGSSETLVVSLLHTARALEERLENALAEVGLSGAKFGALAVLVTADEPLPLSELAVRKSCVRSNITQLVDRLEAEGLVRRVDDPDDRRSVRAAITPLGRERHAVGAERVLRVQEEFVDAMPGEDRAALQRLLAALAP